MNVTVYEKLRRYVTEDVAEFNIHTTNHRSVYSTDLVPHMD